MIKRNRGRTKGGNQMLDFRVYTFLAVCEYMNYTRAAEALHITQPAVSQHIRYLENMYQVKLFLAEGKKIHLSPAGERLLHAATTLKNDEVFLRKQMFEGAGKGLSLRFGTTRTIAVSYTHLDVYKRQHYAYHEGNQRADGSQT